MTTWNRPPAAQEGAGYVLPEGGNDEVRAAIVLVAAREQLPPEKAARRMDDILQRARQRAQGASRG